MKVDYKGTEIEIRLGMKALIMMERLSQTNEAAGPLMQMNQYLWCAMFTTPQGRDISWDDFMDWIDDKLEILTEFSEYVQKTNSIVPKKD